MRGRGLGLGLALLLSACGGDKKELPVSTEGFEQLKADQMIVGFQQFVTQAGLKQAELLGDTAYIFEDSAFAKVKKVHLTLYDEQGKFSAKLESDSGNVNSS